MTKKLKLLASTLMIALGLATPQQLHAMEIESAEIMEVESKDSLVQMLSLLPQEVSNVILERTVALKIRDNNDLARILLFCGETEDTNLKNFKNIILEGIKYNTKDNWFAMEKPCWKAWYGVLGHEATYNAIKNMVVIYRPNPDSDVGMIKLTIPSDVNPLEHTFDLSDKAKFGDVGDYFSISVGYRKEYNPNNNNKVEIWIAPKFLIKQFLATSAKHFEPIMNKKSWDEDKAPVGIIFTGGWWDDIRDYEYLTNKDFEFISNNNCLNLLISTAHRPFERLSTINCFCPRVRKARKISLLF